ncbi:Protein MAINTENANCE OF MERISTEMS [Bienertia sinuspersici]
MLLSASLATNYCCSPLTPPLPTAAIREKLLLTCYRLLVEVTVGQLLRAGSAKGGSSKTGTSKSEACKAAKVKQKFVVHEDDEDQNIVQSKPEEVSEQLEEDFEDDGIESGSDVEGRSKKRAKVSKDGARALAKNLVLYTRSIKSNKQLNVNCRVDQYARIMEALDDQRLRVVEEMGFGTLKFVKGHSLNKGLAYWLMSRVHPETGVFIGGDRWEFPLSPVQVQCVLGIPRGKKVVPIEIDPDNVDNLMRFNDILEWFGKDQCGRGFISIPEAKQEVLREGQLVDVVKFRVAFLVVVLGMLLCPTTNFSTLASDVVPALCAANQPHDYDWCSYVLQFLLRRARSFSKNLLKDGFVVGCGGCTFFLSIFYVDHLKRPPMGWGEFPRIKAWSKDSVSKVAKDDMRSSGDYGKTKTVDVAYGEPHPQAPRDVYPKQSLGMAEEVANRIGEVVSKEMRELKGVVELVLQGRREESFAVRTLGQGTMTATAVQQRIKMAGLMFNIEWAKKYKDTDARLVMDPLFGYNTFTKGKVAREAWLKEFATQATYDGASLTMVFVPFVLQQHWTCICFALKDNSIWVIDSIYSDPLTQHERPIANVIDSMDVFLSEICRGSPWEIGQIQQWPKHSVHVDKQKDISRSCGIHMLMCVDECVDTIPEKFVLESMDQAREALVLRLLLSE